MTSRSTAEPAECAEEGPPEEGVAGVYSAGPMSLVTADPFVDYGEAVADSGVQATGEIIGPAVVAIEGRGSAVGYAKSPKATSGGSWQVARSCPERQRRTRRW